MKIIIDKNIPYIAGVLENFCDVGYFASEQITKEVISDADVIMIRTRTKCNAKLLACSTVKMIATATIGFDHIDLNYCQKNGIQVTSCAGCNAKAVAQWVFAALRELKFNNGILGIVGVGNVGKEVEKIAQKLELKVLRCDPPRAEVEGRNGFVELDYLIKNCDAITLHVPLNGETVGMCDDNFFTQIRGALFLNASRGEVINENSLKKAIDSGRIKKCALDVWNNEPNIDRQLVNMVDIATMHIAGYSIEGKANATRMVVQAVAQEFGFTELINWSPSVTISDNNPEKYDILCDDNLLRSNNDFESLRSNYKYR